MAGSRLLRGLLLLRGGRLVVFLSCDLFVRWHGKPLNKEEAARAIAELQPSAKSGIGVAIPAPSALPAPSNAAPASYPAGSCASTGAWPARSR